MEVDIWDHSYVSEATKNLGSNPCAFPLQMVSQVAFIHLNWINTHQSMLHSEIVLLQSLHCNALLAAVSQCSDG